MNDTATRFWAKVDKSGECWEWTGLRNRYGYGVMSVNNRHKVASRISWELHAGPIPDGLWVLHSCDNPPCVRPTHLWLGTQTDNMQDASRKGRAKSGSKPWSLCKRGHDLNANAQRTPNGRRRCRICMNERGKEWREAHPEAVAARNAARRAKAAERYVTVRDGLLARAADALQEAIG